MKTIAIIQGRLDSTRLPGKVLMPLQTNKTVLENVIERVNKSKHIDEVIVVTTINKSDLKIVSYCANNNIRIFCGSENDVLDRFYQAAKLLNCDYIIRITADCPMIDPNIIDQAITTNLENNADYTITENFPDGLDVEVLTMQALTQAWKEAALASEREHVTAYIRNNNQKFKIANLKSKQDYSNKRWTLDEPNDYQFLKKVFVPLYNENPDFQMEDVLTYLQKHPELEKINQNIIRNEGYLKSLKEDRKLKTNK
jgi:spore coat polysaccharide biosynthesis protein SpsF (cytidylyltransferase family)